MILYILKQSLEIFIFYLTEDMQSSKSLRDLSPISKRIYVICLTEVRNAVLPLWPYLELSKSSRPAAGANSNGWSSAFMAHAN